VIVVDASCALSWCFADESDTYAESILHVLAKEGALVTSHWRLEIANTLLIGERRKRHQQSDTARSITFLDALPIHVDDQTSRRALGDALAIARSYGITVYDAAYLELSLREGLPLATLDSDLIEAARNSGASIALGQHP